MQTVAILPMKSFSQAKRRLDEELTAGARRALAEAMFCDVLVALRRATLVSQTLVVTADHAAQQIAGGHGARVLDDDDRGHNAAAVRGIRSALQLGAERVLLVPGDCPVIDPRELDELLGHEAPKPSVLVIPDRHGTGTNALVLTPPGALSPSFGVGSRERHIDHGHGAGIHAEVVEVPSLALDIDTPEDLLGLQETLVSTHGRAAHTRGMLNQLVRSRS